MRTRHHREKEGDCRFPSPSSYKSVDRPRRKRGETGQHMYKRRGPGEGEKRRPAWEKGLNWELRNRRAT